MIRIVNKHKLMLTLNFPPIEYVLYTILILVIKKNKLHSKEKENIYDNLIESFIDRVGDFYFLNKKDLVDI